MINLDSKVFLFSSLERAGAGDPRLSRFKTEPGKTMQGLTGNLPTAIINENKTEFHPGVQSKGVKSGKQTI
jgi:hypothetical protein